MARWQLEEHHIRLLSTLAKTWDRLREVERRLDVEGLTVPSRQGTKANPLVRIENDLRVVYARLLRELDLDLDAPAEPVVRPPALRSLK